MTRISAVFVAICMVLISASIGAALYLGAGIPPLPAAIVALTLFVGLALYNTIANRLRDRSDVGDQIADLSRGTADLARQVAEIGRRLNVMESRVDTTVNKARGAVDPLAAEIGELGGLVKQLAESVAAHETELRGRGSVSPETAPTETDPEAPAVIADKAELGEPDAKFYTPASTEFRSLGRDGIVRTISAAVEGNRIDLYLQPIVTLPQRKVRYYEAVSRLRTENGDILAADDFIDYAESGGLLPKIDNILLFRCVQVVRRLLLKNRDVGLFCNVSAATLSDTTYFQQVLEFMEANKALAPSLVFEFRQSALRSFGPIENESLAALADRGFRFSLDHVTDLRIEPRDMFERGFRFMKVPAKLLLNRANAGQSDIHPADLADLLARSSIELIAERIEGESTVVDLLDYDVKFGQGFLFSPPRPVRAEALAGASSSAEPAPQTV
ncbi:MAG TPA: EAL domain-containing protein [Pseudolabrys sp.]|nr:EAL domain-containing protein [Pseudolabrys sp.]